MNKNKINKLLKYVADKIDEDILTGQEYMIFVANLLYTFGVSGCKTEGFQDLNFDDSNSVELALNQNPNNVYLASVLQSHILIKWSEGLTNG